MTVASADVRAFLAFEMPTPLREQLRVQLQALRAELPRARWVRSESLHLTVKFLGEHPIDRLERLAAALELELSVVAPVTFTLAGSGFFPNRKRPRVAWVGGTAEGVEPVVECVERCAAAEGVDRERRRWALHLTLARLREGWPEPAVEGFLKWGRQLTTEPFVATELILFRSDLQPGGAVYTPLRRLRFAGSAATE